MTIIRYAVYVLLMVMALHFFLVLNQGSWLEYLDPASIPVVLSGLIFVLASYSLSQVLKAFLQAFGFDVSQSPQISAQIMTTLTRSGFYAGLLGTLMGVLQALAKLENPRDLGVGLAISLLPLVYAVGLHLIVFLPLRQILEQTIEEEMSHV